MTTTEPRMALVVDDGKGGAAPFPRDEVRVQPKAFRGSDALQVAGVAFGSFCITFLVFERLTAMGRGIGFFLAWFALFLVSVYLVARDRLGPMHARDRVMQVLVWSAGAAVLLPLGLIAGYTILKGYKALTLQFFVEDQSLVGPESAATEGGASAAIVGSLQMVGLSLVISVPLGVMTALFLNEVGGRLARPVRTIVDAMSAVPSIVAGLFIYAALVLTVGDWQMPGTGWRPFSQSGFTAALALSVLMLPTVTRTAEVVLRLVPGGLREAGLALGAGEWATTRHIVLPTARTGLLTAVILGMARVIGETAPLILTALGNVFFNANPFEGKQDALPLFVFRLIRFPQPEQIQRAWTGALVLLGIVLVLFVVARIIGGRGLGHIGRLKRMRLARKGLA